MGEIFQPQCFKRLFLAVVFPLAGGCVSTICGSASSCELAKAAGQPFVRYHIGVVRELVPSVAAPDKQVYATNTSTYGLWFDLDTRPLVDGSAGTGFGFGYEKSSRQIFPPECSFVVHVNQGRDVDTVLEMFKNSKIEGDRVCIVSSDNSE